MTDFVVTITDQDMLDGITWAREQYNANLPPPPGGPPSGDPIIMRDAEGKIIEPQAPSTVTEMQVPLDTDDAYVQWVMEQASMSYAQQKLDAEWRAAYETAQMARSAPPKDGILPKAAPKNDVMERSDA